AWLPQIYDDLTRKLEDLGRLQWLREDCRTLVDRAARPVRDEQPQRSYRGASDWPLDRQAMLRRLLLWRDAAARTLDKPKPWLLHDAHALNLAFKAPATSEELFERTRGLRVLRGPQRQELLALLQAPPSPDEQAIAPIPKSLDSAQKRALGEMKDAVAAI